MIHLHDKTFEPFISSDEIAFAIKNMAKQMDDDFFDEIPVFVGVLNGSFMVLSDLMKEYRGMCEVSFLKLSSYEGTETTNQVKQFIGLNHDLAGRTVIVVEDIVDTGLTISFLLKHMKLKNLKSVKLCSLLLKRARLKIDVQVDYLGFDIEDKFVIGYGLDFNGRFRELPYIGVYGE